MNFKHKFPDGAHALVAIIAASMLLGACGGGGNGDGDSSPGGQATPTLALSAGNLGGSGNLDGSGAAARFSSPSGVATDSAGNVYVADSGNNSIRKITAAGVVSTLAGTAGVVGSADGNGAAASFNNPLGVAADSAGNVYVADSGNNTIRKITPAGVVGTLAGTAGVFGSADGSGAAVSFSSPSGVATDCAGNVYVADSGNSTIRKITPGGVVSTLAGTAGVVGSADGSGAAASFSFPNGIATDSAGNLYVADNGNRIIRKITAAGMVSTLAGTAGVRGSADGSGATASFTDPVGVATDSAGNVYVADSARIVLHQAQASNTIRKITAAGVVSTLAGTAGVYGSMDGSGAAARFASPSGIATDSAGNVYVADTSNHTIRKITSTGLVGTLAGTAADGTWAASGIATDSAGNVYVADYGRAAVRRITPAGVVSTLLAGTSAVWGSADGTSAAVLFYGPSGIATDSAGNLYVADLYVIRKITPAGVVSTLAGTGAVSGSADGAGAAASFWGPSGIATDSAGNLYVADSGNNTIRKITPVGVVSTLAGTAGVIGSADGTVAAARFSSPKGIATDSVGNVYVADFGNNSIRKITPAGVVSTLAGAAGVRGSDDGSGAAARFSSPSGIATDSVGNVYVADSGNNSIRKISPVGVVTTVVGGVPGKAGFAAGALPGSLVAPSAVAISGTSLYIALLQGIAVVNHVP